MLLSKCEMRDSKQPRFIKELKASGLLSTLQIKASKLKFLF